MKKTDFSYPKRYWVYTGLTAILAVLLFANIFLTDGLTGEKEFWDFTKKEWIYFAIFLFSEIVIGTLMAFFAIKAGKLAQIRNIKESEYHSELKFSGIKPGDYDYVWFDFSGDERALIIFDGNIYRLYVQDYDRKTEQWSNIGTVSCHHSLDDVKKALFFDSNFFCEENADFDQYGNEVFKENQ